MGRLDREGRPWREAPRLGWEAEADLAASFQDGAHLVEECEAFLSGRFAELGPKHQPVEPWAQLNKVAHAQPEQLRALAAGTGPWYRVGAWPGGRRSRRWQRAVSEIASDLLNLSGGSPRAVRRLQVHALVPLELELATGGRRYGVTPEAMVMRARAALCRSRGRSLRRVSDLETCEAFFQSGGRHGGKGAPVRATGGSRRWPRAAAVLAGALAVGGAGTLLTLAAKRGPGASSLYSYYTSKLAGLDERSVESEQAFHWMTGAGTAPGWEAGRDLPTFLLPWSGEGPGRYVGWLFSGAPGPRVSEAAEKRISGQVPAGATVDAAAGTVSFSGAAVRLDAVALPTHRFVLAGLPDPTVVVRAGARVSVEVVNEDPTSAHGWVVAKKGASSSWMPMARTTPGFPGSALWFLGDPTAAGAHLGTVSFRASTPGTYQYLDPVPGNAKRGMNGTLVVRAV